MSESDEQLVKKTGLFENLDDTKFKKVFTGIQEVKFPSGTVFISEGDQADALFIIKEGAVQVFTLDESNEEIILARLEKGKFFGEQALLTTMPGRRNASVRAVNDIVLLRIDHEYFREVLEFDESLKKKLEKIGHQHLLEKLRALGAEYNLSQYLFDDPKKYEVKEFKSEEIIIAEGDPSDGVYFLLSGFVDVSKKNNQGKEEYICTISPGNIFGEVGVVKEQPRLMTIKAKDPVKIFFITAEKFIELYQSIPEIKGLVETLHHVYRSPQRGEIAQYTGNLMGMPAIVSKFRLKDGREVTSASVVEKNIRSIIQSTEEETQTISFEDVDVYRELLVAKGRLVGVTSYGEWDNIAETYGGVFDERPINEEQIQNFRQFGDLTPPSGAVVEVVEDAEQMICNCMYITRGAITSCIKEGNTTFNEVSEKTGAGTVCGACVPVIESMLGHDAWQAVRISEINHLTDSVRAYQLVSIKKEPLKDFQAGQHIVIQGKINENWVERSYTLTSAPGNPEHYEIAVKREELGLFSRWLFDHDRKLPLLRVSQPVGTFTLDTNQTEPLICLMGGIGITPAVAFARTFVKLKIQRPFYLYYTASNEGEMAYLEELTSLAEKQDSIHFIKHVTSEKGRMQEGDIAKIVEQYPTAVYYICGPKPFENMVMAALIKEGVEDNRIFVEEFTHAGGPQ